MAAHESQMPFIRNLASSDRKLRTASLESLTTFLSSRQTLTSTDAQKLWKGLYYAPWMTDRPVPQQRLATDLANLLFTLQPSCAIPWLRGFWVVVGAGWTDIDVLHALDIWVDELEREEALKDEAAMGFVKAVGELVQALKRCPVKPVRERAGDSYEDERLPWAEADGSDRDEDDEEWGGFDD
ncbi:hypothetical protein CEP51_015632 [Fusarium floridanum]|uniref:Uncharacterized protein n=1 Tax=Fusarium floridanum TaxID=1325733 RepID=A0A428P5Y2_9HYPO|nr:hypothetical protein CEP51_015632 [Fusarium floridanum]